MKRNAILINMAFLIAIVASLIAVRQFMDKSSLQPKKTNPNSADAYMIDASLIQTNELGEREVVLFSPYTQHYPVRNSSYLKKPIIHLYKNNQEWQVTADFARGVEGITTFYLHNHVKIEQPPSAKSGGSVLLTPFLTVSPKLNLITTRSPITILQPGLRIKAIGLKGDLKTGNITLLSKTRGEYDPKLSH